MRIKVQIIVEQDDGMAPIVDEITCLKRGDFSPETLGLTIKEGKQILGKFQKTMINCQVDEYNNRNNTCPKCSKNRTKKDTKKIIAEGNPAYIAKQSQHPMVRRFLTDGND